MTSAGLVALAAQYGAVYVTDFACCFFFFFFVAPALQLEQRRCDVPDELGRPEVADLNRSDRAVV